jgi:hypothetical protein
MKTSTWKTEKGDRWITFFWEVTPCSLIDRYQEEVADSLGWLVYLEDEGSSFLRNVGTYHTECKALHLRCHSRWRDKLKICKEVG